MYIQEVRVLFIRFILFAKKMSLQSFVNFINREDREITKSALYKMIRNEIKVSDEVFSIICKLFSRHSEFNEINISNGYNFSTRNNYLECLDIYMQKNAQSIDFRYCFDWNNVEDTFSYYLAISIMNMCSQREMKYLEYCSLFKSLELDPFIVTFVNFLDIHGRPTSTNDTVELMRLYALMDNYSLTGRERNVGYGIRGLLKHEYARGIQFRFPTKALEALCEAKILFLNGGYLRRSVACMLGEAGIYMITADYDNAQSTTEALLVMSKQMNFTDIQCRALTNLGNLNFFKGDFNQSCQFYEDALNIMEFSMSSKCSYLISLYALGKMEKIKDYLSDSKFFKTSKYRYIVFKQLLNQLTSHETIDPIILFGNAVYDLYQKHDLECIMLDLLVMIDFVFEHHNVNRYIRDYFNLLANQYRFQQINLQEFVESFSKINDGHFLA